MIMLGPGFNALRPGYWHHYNMLPSEVKERVDAGEEHIKIKMRYGSDFKAVTRDLLISHLVIVGMEVLEF